MNDLKDYWYKELKYFLVANSFLVCVFSMGVDSILANDKTEKILSFVLPLILQTSIFSIFVFLTEMVMPEKWRDKIYKWTYYGREIFQDIDKGFCDFRIDGEVVKKHYTDTLIKLRTISEEERKEFSNREWYRRYHSLLCCNKIHFLDREYFLCRDMNFSVAVLLIVYTLITQFGDKIGVNINFTGLVIFVLVIELALTYLATYFAGKRLVREVIIEDVMRNDFENK